MTGYLLRRVLYMLLLLWVLTVVSFVIIQLPRGDYVTTVALRLASSGEEVSQQLLDNLRRRYGLDRPVHVQYLKWFFNLLRGEFGHSFMLNKPVNRVIGERLALSIIISLCTLFFTYMMAIPIGIYSATHQYRISDYLFMSVGFIGLATPNFLLAMILMFFALMLGMSVGGLFSPEYLRAAWGVGKFLDLLRHLPLPVIIVGTAGTAGLIRVMRAQLLDELGKQYVVTACHELSQCRHLPVAVDSCALRDRHRDGVQLHRRWPARRRRSIQALNAVVTCRTNPQRSNRGRRRAPARLAAVVA